MDLAEIFHVWAFLEEGGYESVFLFQVFGRRRERLLWDFVEKLVGVGCIALYHWSKIF